ncbi:MAG: sterol desaturase family protein [Pseudomonadota bacterium]
MDFFQTIFNETGESAYRFFEILTGPVMGSCFLLILFLFAVDIFRKGWDKAFTKRVVSGSFASLAILILNILFAPAVYILVAVLQSTYDFFQIPSIPTTFWDGTPFWLAALIAIVAYDFADYWNHRIMHTTWLWPIHAIHHSDKEVNGLTTFRVHFLEAVVMKGSYILLLSWAGFSPEAATTGAVLLTMHNVYVHADIDWDHGPFKLLLASPRFHRWHHADVEEAYGKNLANTFPFFDYIFGTYHEDGKCEAEMGVPGVPHADVVSLMLYPFTEWSKGIQNYVNARRRVPKSDQQLTREISEDTLQV